MIQPMQFLVLMFFCVLRVQAETCITPNNETAQCTSLYKCVVLLRSLLTQKEDAIKFVRQSHCKGSNTTDPQICCGTTWSFSTHLISAATDLPEDTTSKVKPLSDKKYCGYQHTDDYQGQTENITNIDEFPWTAVFLYKLDPDLEDGYEETFIHYYGCSGSIINARYILTAAKCLRLRRVFAVAARLGEYHIENDEDCTKYKDLDDCSTLAVVGFERKIIHPNFNRRLGINDLALIRTNTTIVFTDYVRPICLPIKGTVFAKPGEILVTTGFGKLTPDGEDSLVKKKIFTQLITNEQCKKDFGNTPTGFLNITNDLICTQDLNNNTVFSCEGDSGAPLMLSRRWQWHLEGFNIRGSFYCGPNYPGVYLRIANYLGWLEENIVPW